MTLTAATLSGEYKFDNNERSGFMLEPNNPEWGLCDHYLLPADYRDDEEDYDDEWDDYDERYGYSRQTAQAPTYHT